MIADTFIRESAKVYHATKGYLSSHRLAEFRRCPRLFRDRELGDAKPVESNAFAFGQAAHVLILEGEDVYDDEVVVGGPVNPKTDKPYGRDSKAFAEWASAQIGIAITSEEDALVWQLADSVWSHEVAIDLLSDGLAERVIRTNLFGVPFQCRMDWLTEVEDQVALVDLKTCEDLDWFESDAKKFGYVYQLALYRSMLALHIGQSEARVGVYIIAVEKREPYRCGVWKLDAAGLDRAAAANAHAIEEYRVCLALDVWPTRFEGKRVLTF